MTEKIEALLYFWEYMTPKESLFVKIGSTGIVFAILLFLLLIFKEVLI